MGNFVSPRRSKSIEPDHWLRINRARYRQQKEHDAAQRASQGTFGLFYDEDSDDDDDEADKNPTAYLTKDEMVRKFFFEHYGLNDIPFKDGQQELLARHREVLNLALIAERGPGAATVLGAGTHRNIRGKYERHAPAGRALTTSSDHVPLGHGSTTSSVHDDTDDSDPFAHAKEIARLCDRDKMSQHEKQALWDAANAARDKQRQRVDNDSYTGMMAQRSAVPIGSFSANPGSSTAAGSTVAQTESVSKTFFSNRRSSAPAASKDPRDAAEVLRRIFLGYKAHVHPWPAFLHDVEWAHRPVFYANMSSPTP